MNRITVISLVTLMVGSFGTLAAQELKPPATETPRATVTEDPPPLLLFVPSVSVPSPRHLSATPPYGDRALIRQQSGESGRGRRVLVGAAWGAGFVGAVILITETTTDGLDLGRGSLLGLVGIGGLVGALVGAIS